MSTLEFTFLMIAVGSLGGLVSGLLGLPWWAQVVIAAILALLLLLAVKPPLLRRLKRGGDPTKTLVDALIGMEGTVVSDFVNGQGHVKLTVGETWTARVSPATQPPLEVGDRITVTAIDGATAMVAPVKGNEK
ncbi:MAG: NfeD family protein [Salinibacterium sp.]|nr:NfeD family protein [Micrococcales bacterium]MBX3079787.1 NfeD family protein [Cryobacterium sp.]MCB1280352.1 NfeD family protein [Salinibacterium sp.]